MSRAPAPHRLFISLASVFGALIICTLWARAQVTSTTEPAELEALIRQLSSDDWPRRQQAEERLVQLAADAVPHLREVARTSEDAEVRTRCESALHRIAQNERIGPTVVTLHLAGATPREAFEALARQASPSGAVTLRPHPPTLWDTGAGAAGGITLDVDHVPFWEAARRLGAATGLELRPWNDELRISSAGDRRLRGPSAVSGPLLIVANAVNRAAAVDLSTGAATSDFTVSLTVVPEPKLRVLRSWPHVRIDQAVDENGTSLVPPPGRPDGYHSSPRQSSWPVIARLAYPPNAGKRIALLRGTVTFAAQTQSETVEVRDLMSARDVRRELGAGSVTVVTCRQIGNQYELVLVLSRGRQVAAGAAPPPWDQFRQSLLPGLRVLDAEGRPLQRGSPSMSGGEDRMETTVRFSAEPVQPQHDRPGPPAKLVWEIPTESREINAPFELKDLPMP